MEEIKTWHQSTYNVLKTKHLWVFFVIGLLCTVYLPSVLMQPDNYGKIAFVSSRDKDMQVYVMNADGSNPIKISSTNCVCFLPAWSPDGREIAFTVDCGILAVYVINADGSNCRNLTSPLFDGKKIAFSVGTYIAVVNTDGSDPIWIDVDGYSPAWSPDGKKIAFSLSGEGISVMNSDGSAVRDLTFHGWNPSWSPDGKRIAFNSDKDGNKDIYVMNADGTDVQKLTFDPASDYHPT